MPCFPQVHSPHCSREGCGTVPGVFRSADQLSQPIVRLERLPDTATAIKIAHTVHQNPPTKVALTVQKRTLVKGAYAVPKKTPVKLVQTAQKKTQGKMQAVKKKPAVKRAQSAQNKNPVRVVQTVQKPTGVQPHQYKKVSPSSTSQNLKQSQHVRSRDDAVTTLTAVSPNNVLKACRRPAARLVKCDVPIAQKAVPASKALKSSSMQKRKLKAAVKFLAISKKQIPGKVNSSSEREQNLSSSRDTRHAVPVSDKKATRGRHERGSILEHRSLAPTMPSRQEAVNANKGSFPRSTRTPAIDSIVNRNRKSGLVTRRTRRGPAPVLSTKMKAASADVSVAEHVTGGQNPRRQRDVVSTAAAAAAPHVLLSKDLYNKIKMSRVRAGQSTKQLMAQYKMATEAQEEGKKAYSA